MTYKSYSILVLGALALAGCDSTRESYETTPVVVQSAQGPLTCQLYTADRVLWDRAIQRPESMTQDVADAVCRAEGERRKTG